MPGWGSGRFGSRDSENSDLRDVIDDLTVENKKLKKRLIKYEKAEDPTPEHDKMFEVRMHGLSSSKKRDLEELLANFVTTMSSKGKRVPQAASSTNNSSSNLISDTSMSQQLKSGHYPPTDSAYASVSHGRPTSTSRSGPTSNSTSTQSRMHPRVSSKSRDKNIKSYLHNIPESLLPKSNPLMRERAKKKLVVQRLEHLFTGTSASPGLLSQPMQQQEVSRSAAVENRHKVEGSREAHIMLEPKEKLERKDSASDDSDDSLKGLDRQTVLENRSPNQRPTRPLDLDIHRAQVPAENLQYIRHLGLNSPSMHNDEERISEGWVYLNLLMSMAQLHTLNVTPEFIKKAVTDMSDKFELSSDGRKIRWKGGEEGTKFSSNSGSNTDMVSGGSPDESTTSLNISNNVPGSKHASKTSSAIDSSRPVPSQSTSGELLHPSPSKVLKSSSEQQKSKASSTFDYKPIVLKKQIISVDESDDYMFPEYDTPSHTSRTGLGGATGQSSSLHDPQSETRQSQQSEASDGALIFYRNAPYCTDFGGDRRAIEKSGEPLFADGEHVLGISVEDEQLDTDHRHPGFEDFEVSSVNDQQEAKVRPLKLVPLTDVSGQRQDFQEFPVSGLGGVVPADNFLVDVRTRHSVSRTEDGKGKQARNKPEKNYSVISASKLDLPPSRLPPPSYVFLPIASSSSSAHDDDFSDDDDITESSLNEDMPAPVAMMIHFSSGSFEEEESSEEENGDDDSSIDMLDAARAAEPDAIAARERDYESNNNIEKFVTKELPAGSSAASAGGGSGYASRDGSPLSMDIGPPSLKRGRSSTDSKTAMGRSRKSHRTE